MGGVSLYILMQNLVKNEVNTELFSSIHYVFNEITRYNKIDNSIHFVSSEPVEIKKIEGKVKIPSVILKDTILYNNMLKSYAPYRQLSTVVKVGNDFYRIRIFKSLITSNILIEKVAMVITLMLLLFLLLAFFINRYLFKRVWLDFFETLHKIQEFSLVMPQKKAFSSSEIIEFNELNQLLNNMTDKIINDYEGLKEFTGNLSHEVQTPLAIIKNKSELLLQETLSEKQYEIVGSVYSATNRLSAIIRSLGLISRIDNNQFTSIQPIDFEQVIKNQMSNFEHLIDSRNIKVEHHFSGNPTLNMNAELADILINNLIKNAVRHNNENGYIKIHLTPTELIIANSGDDPGMPTEKLFEQFSRASDEGFMGIGLSIVRKITQHYNMGIRYEYENKQHQITVAFSVY